MSRDLVKVCQAQKQKNTLNTMLMMLLSLINPESKVSSHSGFTSILDQPYQTVGDQKSNKG